MKQTCLQENTTCPDLSENTNEQTINDPDIYGDHRARMLVKKSGKITGK